MQKLATMLDQAMNDAIPARTRRKIIELQEQLSDNHLAKPTSNDVRLQKKIEKELAKVDLTKQMTKEGLEAVANGKPTMAADFDSCRPTTAFDECLLEDIDLGDTKEIC